MNNYSIVKKMLFMTKLNNSIFFRLKPTTSNSHISFKTLIFAALRVTPLSSHSFRFLSSIKV